MSFPGADIGSDHYIYIHLQNPKKNKFILNKFDLEKMKNPETKKLFEKKNEKLMEQKLTEIQNIEEMLHKLNITIRETATEILGKYREKKWKTNEQMEPGSTIKQINTNIKKEMRIAKETGVINMY